METETMLATYQQNELSPQDSQWQRPEFKTVQVFTDQNGFKRKIRQVSENKFEVSLYKGNPATAAEMAQQIDKLRRNYTMMKPDFFAALANELANDEWPVERIKDAVTHLLRTKEGGFISIADVFNYDKPMKLYNHSGYCWLILSHRATDVDCCGPKSDFGKLEIDGKTYFYLKKDLPKRQ